MRAQGGIGGRLSLLAASALVLAACGPVGAAGPLVPPSQETSGEALPQPAPTETPLEPLATQAPLSVLTPAVVLEPPAPTPTPTLPPLPSRLPQERLAILAPGPGSQVTSPFTVSGRSGPCHQNRVRIRLIGEDGRLLAQRITYLWAPPGYSGVFTTELSFHIEAVAEAARLEVSTDDMRSTRLGHLSTLNVVLLSVGAQQVYPGLEGPERLTILSPREGTSVSGGVVRVRGAGWVDADVPLAVQLLDRYGTVLGSGEARLTAPEVGLLGTFEVDLAYQIPYPQYAWVAVAERTPDGSGLIHYSSQEIWLRP